MDPWDLTKSAYEDAKKAWLCPGCVSPRPSIAKVDAVVEGVPDAAVLNFINGCGVGIAREDFLADLGDMEVGRDLGRGRLFLADGSALRGWVTFIGREKILIRGSKNVSARECPDCKKQLYFAMGKKYLHPEPKQGVSIFDSGWGGLVVTADIMNRVTLNKWPKINSIKLPVLNVPKDNLGILLP